MEVTHPEVTKYISGKITGVERTAEKQFQAVEDKLTAKGFKVINPFKLDHNHDKTWESYMKVCIAALVNCDVIVMLPNWQNSPGAKIELQIALNLGIEVEIWSDITNDTSKTKPKRISYGSLRPSNGMTPNPTYKGRVIFTPEVSEKLTHMDKQRQIQVDIKAQLTEIFDLAPLEYDEEFMNSGLNFLREMYPEDIEQMNKWYYRVSKDKSFWKWWKTEWHVAMTQYWYKCNTFMSYNIEDWYKSIDKLVHSNKTYKSFIEFMKLKESQNL